MDIVAVLLIGLFVYALWADLAVMQRWADRPVLFVVPLVGLIATIAIAIGTRRGDDALPFRAIVALFEISFWPYMIPFSVTIKQAAAPASSLSFLFWGAGLFILPLMLIYTFCSCHLFRGKVDGSAGRY
ncbi:hypothetical protein HBDW_23830 [Herbaspirillum sp. DW155]|uniref:cytochrome d ubiquinol oxidase subunit II n=1 Tax=Herbaspirillum sp. DW155 TaxID=3095609 RepID=UPI00308798E4|nr:hypothetical protein HBDW_23830 [Herbaspirillum sp. DW155]